MQISILFLSAVLFGFTLPPDTKVPELPEVSDDAEPINNPKYSREHREARWAQEACEKAELRFFVPVDGETKFSVKNNLYIQINQHTPEVEEWVYIYPIRKEQGDFVYSVSVFKNVSDTEVPHVAGDWKGMLGSDSYSFQPVAFIQREINSPWEIYNPYPLPLAAGKPRLNWFKVFHEKLEPFSERVKVSNANLVHQQWVSKDFRLKLPAAEGYCVYGPQNLYVKRDGTELALITQWYDYPQMSVSSDIPEQFLEDWLIGDTAWNADENQLQPCTTRDEIQLSRMISEYLHTSDETLDAEKLSQLLEFVAARPFPQKIAMTHRLYRFDRYFNLYEDKSYYSGSLPSNLPEGWEAKLLKLNEKFREIRENALEE